MLTLLLSSQMRLLAFVVVLFAVTQAEEGARLLASKSLLNRYAVEGRDLTLQYNIYNVGSRWEALGLQAGYSSGFFGFPAENRDW